MARGIDNGWDFVKEGGIYQYKEDYLICMVEILNDNSDKDGYSFVIRVLSSNIDNIGDTFTVYHKKNDHGIYSGMSQFYRTPKYVMLPVGTPWPFGEKFLGMGGLANEN